MNMEQEFKSALAAISESVDGEEFDVIITEAADIIQNGMNIGMDEAVLLAAVDLSDAGVISESAYAITDSVMEAFEENTLISSLSESVDRHTFDNIINAAGNIIQNTGCSITEAVACIVNEADDISNEERGANAFDTIADGGRGFLKRAGSRFSASKLGKLTGAQAASRVSDYKKQIADNVKKNTAYYDNELEKLKSFKEDEWGKAGFKSKEDYMKRIDQLNSNREAAAKNARSFNVKDKNGNLVNVGDAIKADRREAMIRGGATAATGLTAAGAARAYHNYKKHGDALYDIHRIQQKRAERKKLKDGNTGAANEAASALEYLHSCY